ncbi:MAG: proline--tRNA ligase, partial [Candidatus Omnitrophica bacterium]|nr:proline--tRNA ligase [Candidatus Omnitrophota bacterium]
ETALGPTHEEIVTDLVAREVRSYKDLPLILYQVQNKFRDEVRPRFGVVRSCEFIMKDAYSFDVDVESMEKSYKLMYDAYCKIFDRCALPYLAVEADPGLMGGSVSHEFMVPCDIGEDRIAVCSVCGYAASTEVAAVKERNMGQGGNNKIPRKKMEEVRTPGVTTVEQVSAFLKVKASDLIKTLIYLGDNSPVAVLIRGDHEANEAKIKKYLKVKVLELADAEKIRQFTGGDMGFSGPVGLSMRIIADRDIKDMVNCVTGANKKDTHLSNVNPDLDFKVGEYFDARVITPDDPCPKCNSSITLKHAIEIGHTFKLGTKYSEPLGAMFLDANGKEKPVIMGCYGIGVNRILATLVETSYDKDGIIWPVSLSPCEAVVVPVNKEEKDVSDQAENIYQDLLNLGIDAIIDDRDKTAGVKFKDSDLVGFPYQIIVGKRSLEQNKIEFKDRSTGKKELIDKDKIVDFVREKIASQK